MRKVGGVGVARLVGFAPFDCRTGGAGIARPRFAFGGTAVTLGSLTESTETRIDKWLWAVRVFKTRAQALAACRAGHVKIKGVAVKPGRPVRIGDVMEVRTSGPTRTLEVLGVTPRRVSAKQLPELIRDHTPPEELERARRTPVEQVLSRPKGSGRPTKRELRMIDRWLP